MTTGHTQARQNLPQSAQPPGRCRTGAPTGAGAPAGAP